MRYFSILIAVITMILLTVGCQEESTPSQPKLKPADKEVPQKMGMQAVTKSPTVSEHVKEESHKAMVHAKAEAHERMKKTHESNEQTHDGVAIATASNDTLEIGKEVYGKTCVACHATGVSGAPKTGDKGAWSGHIHHGLDHMTESVIKGKGAMPARGGNDNLTDEEIEAAVNYILEQSR